MIKVVIMEPLYVDSRQYDCDNWEDALSVIDTNKRVVIRRSKFERDVTFVWVHFD